MKPLLNLRLKLGDKHFSKKNIVFSSVPDRIVEVLASRPSVCYIG